MKYVLNKRLYSILFCFILIIAFSMGCQKIDDQPAPPDIIEDETTGESLMLTDSGDSKYSIVIPSQAGVVEKYAATELQQYINNSSGCKIAVVTDENTVYDTNNYFISVGKTSLLLQSEIQVEYEKLKDSGFKIANKGNMVIISGADEYGTLYGVYYFLKHQIGYEAYAVDEIYYTKARKLYVYDFKDCCIIPSINSASVALGNHWLNPVGAARMGLVGAGYGGKLISGSLWGAWAHSINALLPPEEYPQYYSGNHICMTNEAAISAMADKIKEKVLEIPTSKYFMLGHPDDYGSCQCADCIASAQQHGGISGTYMIFLNKIADIINEWKEEIDLEREIIIVGLFYHSFESPPSKYDAESNTFVPYDSEVIARNNVAPMYAPIGACFGHAFDDENCTINKSYQDAFLGWSACTNKLMLWLYSTDFHNYFLSFNDWGSLSGNAKFFKKHNVFYIVDQANHKNDDSPFAELRLYLRSKLWWDADLDVNILIKKFMDNYYKEASPYIYEYFNAVRDNYARIYTEEETGGCISYNRTPIDYAGIKYWEFETLTAHQKIINKAYEAIENSDNTEEIKSIYNKRILSEEINITYFLIKNHSNYYLPKEFSSMEDNFYRDCILLGIRRPDEWSTL